MAKRQHRQFACTEGKDTGNIENPGVTSGKKVRIVDSQAQTPSPSKTAHEYLPSEMYRSGMKVTFIGMVVNLLLIFLKFAGGIFGSSKAMMADAMHSFSDFITDFGVLIGLRFISKPADSKHPYGHGRLETAISLFMGLFIILTGIGILKNASYSIILSWRGIFPKMPGIIALLTGIISIVFTLISLNTFSLEFSGAILFGLDCFLIVLLGFDLITEISTFLKNKPSTVHKTSRIGSILIHLGFAILLLGILGVENGVENFIVTLGVGESKKIEKFDLIGHSSQTYVNSENRITYESSFLLKQNEEIQSILIPRIHNFENLDIVTSQPAIYYGLFRDIQLILRDWNAVNYQGSTIDILVYPLAIWIWIGGGIMVFGGILKIKNNAVLHAKSFSNHKADKSK